MTASQPAQLGWKPESPMEWGQRICSGVSSHIAEMGQQYQQLKSDLRQPCKHSLHVRAHLRSKTHRVSPLRASPFAAAIPGDSAIEQVLTTGFSSFLSLYNTIIIARILLTWFPNPPQAIASPLSTLCDPYLNLFRGIIPPIGGTLDLSPILAFIVLDLFQNTAAALPAELGPDGSYEVKQRRRQFRMLNPTRAALAWHKRLMAQKQRAEAGSASSM
ncbi:g12812 [Coccomyxa viridis]|uniref:G12812 protein n=1 Tax=Coccomyxa viridis TaxID=1274662 RepID=A0ABP1GFG6_9CHLO